VTIEWEVNVILRHHGSLQLLMMPLKPENEQTPFLGTQVRTIDNPRSREEVRLRMDGIELYDQPHATKELEDTPAIMLNAGLPKAA
jgi:hypothetical protein